MGTKEQDDAIIDKVVTESDQATKQQSVFNSSPLRTEVEAKVAVLDKIEKMANRRINGRKGFMKMTREGL